MGGHFYCEYSYSLILLQSFFLLVYCSFILFDVQVIIDGSMDYSLPSNIGLVDKLLSDLESSQFVDATYTESWLHSFIQYSTNLELNITNNESFISNLKVL